MPVSAATVVSEVVPTLNAASTDDLVFWTESELYAWINEALQSAAREARVFMVLQLLNVTAGAGEITLPENFVSITRASWDGVALRECTVAELEALDDSWPAAVGVPKRWTVDVGLNAVRLYPSPDADGALHLVAQVYPTVTTSAPIIQAAAPFAGFLRQALLGAARGKVSDAQMPEIAAHCAERARLYRELFRATWGQGE